MTLGCNGFTDPFRKTVMINHRPKRALQVVFEYRFFAGEPSGSTLVSNSFDFFLPLMSV